MNSLKLRVDNTVFYSPILHKVISEGSLNSAMNSGVDVGIGHSEKVTNVTNKLDSSGVYLVTFRNLRKDSNEIIYSYVYYPDVFTNSILGHLIIKSGFSSSFLFKDFGDFWTIIDSNLGVDPAINIVKNMYHELNEHWAEYSRSADYKMAKNCLTFLDNVKKMTVVTKIDDVIEYLDLIIKKDFLNLFTKHYGKDSEKWFSKFITSDAKDIYFLKDCLFVVKDLDYVLQSLLDKNYKLKKRTKQNELSSFTSFLSHLDSDYRNNLYKHHLDKVQHNIIPANNKLSRSKFNFHNIHQKIGNVKL